MAYHKWDAEYWEKQCSEAHATYARLQRQYCDLQAECRRLKDRSELLDKISRPILFIQEGSIDPEKIPEHLRLTCTILEYKQGYPEPQWITSKNPFAMGG